MKDELIIFETAKLANEKGYDLPSAYWFNSFGLAITSPMKIEYPPAKTKYPSYSRPTQSLLQKWLREVHNIYIIPTVDIETKKYSWELYNFSTNESKTGEWSKFDTYEEAFEEGLQEALKLIK